MTMDATVVGMKLNTCIDLELLIRSLVRTNQHQQQQLYTIIPSSIECLTLSRQYSWTQRHRTKKLLKQPSFFQMLKEVLSRVQCYKGTFIELCDLHSKFAVGQTMLEVTLSDMYTESERDDDLVDLSPIGVEHFPRLRKLRLWGQNTRDHYDELDLIPMYQQIISSQFSALESLYISLKDTCASALQQL
ncbi:hypothetical protein SAMD00019534_084330 [Acytostelium subglobosum LB1]|uniref:hypothetical protein n=1 Tax=Acytostelium subglobosum LB1 TaxID=1410327 RepID=UPI000644C5B8|nr:hypothetical protein SAMD00019534_084330 [Acytostelium subglobosum LB1]GAM25258.1 hypothetical protein SAMD00019534_084330 [Acytostelium subglobosum LB1]|eukprot:XP_012751778.1 hypothetical protein SAMD00019534_084330 [Acytostelium subglobosum LB1]